MTISQMDGSRIRSIDARHGMEDVHPAFAFHVNAVIGILDHHYPTPAGPLLDVRSGVIYVADRKLDRVSALSVGWRRHPDVRVGLPTMLVSRDAMGPQVPVPSWWEPRVDGRRGMAVGHSTGLAAHEYWHFGDFLKNPESLSIVETAIGNLLGLRYTARLHAESDRDSVLRSAIADHISTYAANQEGQDMGLTVVDELMAEVFSEIVCSDSPRPFALDMRDTVREVAGRDSALARRSLETNRHLDMDWLRQLPIYHPARIALADRLGVEVRSLDTESLDQYRMHGWAGLVQPGHADLLARWSDLKHPVKPTATGQLVQMSDADRWFEMPRAYSQAVAAEDYPHLETWSGPSPAAIRERGEQMMEEMRTGRLKFEFTRRSPAVDADVPTPGSGTATERTTTRRPNARKSSPPPRQAGSMVARTQRHNGRSNGRPLQ